jgi:hypothetical protein
MKYYFIPNKYNKILLLDIKSYISLGPNVSPVIGLLTIYKGLILSIFWNKIINLFISRDIKI